LVETGAFQLVVRIDKALPMETTEAVTDTISALIEASGPAIEEVVEVQEIEKGSWRFAFDEATAVYVDHVEEQEKLVLSADLGAPPDESRGATHAFLLYYNFIWRETGGVRMGLNSSNGHIVMIYDLHAGALDVDSFANALLAFTEQSLVWRDLVAAGLEEGADPLETTAELTAIRI